MSDVTASLKAVIELDNTEVASAVIKALAPEAEIKLRGVRTEIRLIGGTVIEIVVEAPDYSAFRAAVNALLRLTSSTLELIKELSGLAFQHQ
ncbi:MAG: CTAG/PCC1 family protein [Desulfurococcales archaeon]|nr:CTAG/PCC1 family protein [Desulfurococcales archaeon]